MVDEAARVLPHDVEAEAAVLSAVLLDGSAIDQVADVLRPEHFYGEAHRRIFEAVLDVRETQAVADIVLVATRLRDTDRLAQVGGMAYLTEVLNAAPAVLNVRKYADVVIDKWRVRVAIQICNRHELLGYCGGFVDASGFVQSLAQEVHALACEDNRSTSATICQVLTDNIRTIQAAAQSGRHISGLPTGLDRYDRLTAGLHNGEMTIVAARPGMGKTSLVLDWARNVAALEEPDTSRPNAVIVFSLEMMRDQLVNRMLCSAAMVDSGRLRTGMLSPTDWSRISEAAGLLSNLDIVIDDGVALSVVDIRSKSRRAASDAHKNGRKLALVVVDYLQLMKGREGAPREQEVSEISRGLKAVAKELGVPLVALSQLNRAVETRGEKSKRPQLSDLRESGAIEQDADNVVFIYRDDYYRKESPDRGIAELIVAKQRNGPTSTVKVRFESEYTRFDNLPDVEFDEEARYGT